MKTIFRTLFALCVLFLAASCSTTRVEEVIPTPDLEETVRWMVDDAVVAVATQLMRDVEIRLETMLPTEIPVQSATPSAQPTVIAATSIPNALRTSEAYELATMFPCIDELEFVRDISIPDHTQVAANKPFTKTWEIRNAGTCSWDNSYQLVFSRGVQMAVRDAVPLPDGTLIAPGDTIEISVYMTAPEKIGTYTSYWMMQNSNGQSFGAGENRNKEIWVKVDVL